MSMKYVLSKDALDKAKSYVDGLFSNLSLPAIGRTAVTKAANATLTAAELKAGMILASKGSAQTLTLPTASTALAGIICTIVRITNASAVTITDGTLSNATADAIGDCVTVGCTGAAWYVVSSTVAA